MATQSFTFNEAELQKFVSGSGQPIERFFQKVGLEAKKQGEILAKRRLSKPVSGPGPDNYHRGPNKFNGNVMFGGAGVKFVGGSKPGRTGRYEKKFYYRRVFGGDPFRLIFGNASSYAQIVESGTRKTNYPIPKSGGQSHLIFWNGSGYTITPNGVTHPGPWSRRSTSYVSLNPRASALLGKRGKGSWIVTDSIVNAFVLTERTLPKS
jgi:hypothetical protein